MLPPSANPLGVKPRLQVDRAATVFAMTVAGRYRALISKPDANVINRTRMRQGSTWLALLAGALTGCAGAGATRDAPATTAVKPAGSAINQEVDAAAVRYRAALSKVAKGDAAGRTDLSAASVALLDAATLCQADADCDRERVVSVYDALLARRAQGIDEEGFASIEESPEISGESPLVADLPAAQQSITLLKGRDLRELIVLNEPMKAALNEWLTWMRPMLIDSWENYQYLRWQMWPEYQRAGLPEALLFGIMAKESAGKVHAVSRSGAAGPLQFMPATGLRFGLNGASGFDTRFDPQLSARANVAYLNERFAELNNNLELTLAAYNGGEGRVGRLYRKNPGRGFYDPGVYAQLPPETRDYVPMVLAAAWLFLHPEEHGLEFPRVDRGEPVIVALERPASLNELAICVGNRGSRGGWFRTLRNLNPRHDPTIALAQGTSLRLPPQLAKLYKAHCLAGERARVASEIARSRKPSVTGFTPQIAIRNTSSAAAAAAKLAAKPAARTHTVRRGETLAAIARRYECGSAKGLAQANGLKPPNYTIHPGQRIKLSGCS